MVESSLQSGVTDMINEIRSPEDMEALVREWGFLPFFKNEIRGFSIEEHTPPELWYDGDGEWAPWDWKGPVARMGTCVYGKLFWKKAGFVSMEWFPDLANLRRDGYDFDARFDDELASYKDKEIFDTVQRHGSLQTGQLKKLCGYGGKDGKKGFETVITRLQMQTYITVADFDYATDRHGVPYGWGIARYSTPEAIFGYEAVTAAYCRTPEQSRRRLTAHLEKLLPHAGEKQIAKLLNI